MSILLNFPPPPPSGCQTLSEQNGQLTHLTKAELLYQSLKVVGYPVVNISKESSRSHSHRETAKSAFLPHDETVWRRTMHAWHESGLCGAFEEIVNNKSQVPAWMSSLSQVLLAVVRGGNSLHGSLFPHLSLSNEEIIARFTNIADWSSSPVRAFAWHPHTTKFAFALQDDTIHVHTAGNDLVPVLKHKLQKNVADLAWMPQSASVLAVGCQSCVLIWHVDPMSLATRPSASSVQVLQQSGHGPVTSLSWDPDGSVLLSASPVDTAIMAWDVPMETCVPLRRAGGGGISLLKWSPDGKRLFAATPSTVFRVWETRTWTSEKWSNLAGKCTGACWSPDGRTLLFTTENEPVIYYLNFSSSDTLHGPLLCTSKTAVTCVNVTETEYEVDDEVIRIGGNVQTMTWDPTGERLAVTFKESENCENKYVVVFRTKTSPVLELTPCGFVKGEDGASPSHVSFQPKYNQGALLTVVWSNGKIGYIPLNYVHSSDVAYHRFQQMPDINRSVNINNSLYSSFT